MDYVLYSQELVWLGVIVAYVQGNALAQGYATQERRRGRISEECRAKNEEDECGIKKLNSTQFLLVDDLFIVISSLGNLICKISSLCSVSSLRI